MAGRAATIAVVDDEADITASLAMALEDHGYQVVTTNDARGALDLLERVRPDVLVLDLLMPQVTGAGLYARIRDHPSLGRTPVVILSGIAPGDAFAGFATRPGTNVQFVEKPIDIARILVAIEHALQGRAEVPA
jgi:DNA-binding NtrC family response regulator